LKLGKRTAAFLDTTFLLPFFQIDIEVEAFTLDRFKQFLTTLSEVHFSELSVFEAKAKIHRLSRINVTYVQALKAFGGNLSTLREDEKTTFHPYTELDDAYSNLVSSKKLKLDSFDMMIMAQALDVGTLITEDKEIPSVREQQAFVNDPMLGKKKIRRWRELLS